MDIRLVGIDGGGTKTDAVLCAGDGTVLSRRIGEASSPTSQSLERAEACLCDVLKALLSPYGGLAARLDGVFAGISGGGLKKHRLVLGAHLCDRLTNARNVVSGSDSINAISCALGQEDGIVAISGTGSSVFARTEGRMRQVGGWGYLLGDEGSGYDLGRMALRAVLLAWDGRGGQTFLSELCAKRLGVPVQEGIETLYEGGRTLIASFAPCALEAREAGDEVAAVLCERAARGLLEAIVAAGRWVDLPRRPVAMAGSVWQSGGYFERQIGEWLGSGYELVRAQQPPVYGAVVEAARQAGIAVDADFERRFANTITGGA